MSLFDLLLFSIANLKRNKMRTLLTIAGVVVGIAAIVFLVSLGFGLQNLVETQVGSMKELTQIQVDANTAKIDKAAVKKFEKVEGVKWVAPAYYLSAQMFINNRKVDVTLYGVKPKRLEAEGVKADVGKSFSSDNGKEIVVSRASLKVFDLLEAKNILDRKAKVKIFLKDKSGNIVLKIQDQRQIQQMKIVGVTKGTKETAIYTPISNLKPFDIANYDKAIIKTKNREVVKSIKDEVTSMGFRATSIKDTINEIQGYFRVAQVILGIFGLIALFVASIGIFNTMTISLLERTHEIGVMKAIGGTNRDIRRIFLFEAAQIGIWGGIFGLIGGWIGGYVVNSLVNILARSFQGQASGIFLIPWQFGAVSVFFALIVSFMAGIYPARRAGKLNPIEAIRYE